MASQRKGEKRQIEAVILLHTDGSAEMTTDISEENLGSPLREIFELMIRGSRVSWTPIKDVNFTP